MTSLFITLLICSLSMSLLIVLALLFTHLGRKRYQAGSLYLVWLVILIGLLIPWRPVLWQVQSPLPISGQTTDAMIRVSQPENETAQLGTTVLTQPSGQMDGELQTPAQRPGTQTMQNTMGQGLQINYLQLLPLIWLAGVALVLGLSLQRHARLLASTRRWGQQVHSGLAFDELQHIKTQLGIKRNIKLYINPTIDSPLVHGLLTPCILLPDAHFSLREMQLVFRHELTHLKRGDLWAKALALLVTALHWFNPLVWLSAAQANIHCEASCDALLMAGRSFSERRDYSQTIVASLRDRGQTASGLSTAFRGGKQEMKHRISLIMDLKNKRFAALLLTMMLVLSGISGIALTEPVNKAMETLISNPSETNYKGVPVNRVEFAPRKALVMDPNQLYGGLCIISDDYEIPAAAYLNGTPVIVTQRETTRGGFPVAINDPTEQWVLAEVVVPQGSHLVSGWIPQAAIRYLDEEDQSPAEPTQQVELQEAATQPAFPKGKLVDPSGSVVLFFDNGLTKDVVTTLPAGTEATLIGYMYRFYHVLVGEMAGFIGRDQIVFEGEDQKLFEQARPKDIAGYPGLSDIMVGHQERYQEYSVKFDALYGVMDWESVNHGLATRAALSALSEEYGYRYTENINVLPGPEDLTEPAVAALGKQLLKDEFGIADDIIQGTELFFYHLPGKPEERFWRVLLYMAPGHGNASVVLDQTGKPIEYFQGQSFEYTPDPQPDKEQLAQMQTTLDYYLHFFYADYPGENDLTQAEALRIGMATVREMLGSTAEGMKLSKSTFHHRAEHGISWWLMDYMTMDAPFSSPHYYVVVVSPKGDSIITSDPASYLNEVQYLEEQKEFIAYYLDQTGFTAPAKEEYTREEAIDRAWEVFTQYMPDTDPALMKLVDAAYYSKYRDPVSYWLVSLTYQNNLPEMQYNFDIALLSPRGEAVVTTDPGYYLAHIESTEQEHRRIALEKDRGPFYTWTLEQQAEFYPNGYKLPPEGAISQEEAIATAREVVKTEFGLTDADLDLRITTCFYTAEDLWLVEFHTEKTIITHTAGFFQVFIKPMDGSIFQLQDDKGNG